MPAILITGASRGFGHALCGVYRQRGWTTFPLVRDGGTAAVLQREGGAGCHPIVADVATADAENAIARTLAVHGQALDVLINNAGNIRKSRGLAATQAEDLEITFRVHCIGVLHSTKAALPFLRQAMHPVVVNVSSRWGSIGRTVAGQGGQIYAYQIAKCAQNMLTACLDHELRPHGIRCFAVHPGKLTTAAAAADADTDPAYAAGILADWIDRADDRTVCGFHDVLSGSLIEW